VTADDGDRRDWLTRRIAEVTRRLQEGPLHSFEPCTVFAPCAACLSRAWIQVARDEVAALDRRP
jgi:hypothetical protein